MAKFQYIARNEESNSLSGVVQAADRKEAVSRLKELGYYILELKEEGGAFRELKESRLGRLRRVPHNDLAVFTWQLASLLGAGLSVVECLRTLVQQLGGSRLCPIVEQISLDVEKTSSLSKSMAKHSWVFDSIYVAVVRAGEEGGVLPEALSRLAKHLRTAQEIRGKIRSALAYPIFLLLLGAGTILVLFAVVVPRFAALFISANQELPLPTRMMLEIGSFTERYWWAMGLGLSGAVLIGISALRRPTVHGLVDRWLLRIPLLRSLLIRIEMARFSRTLGELLNSKVPILNAIQVTRGVAKNRDIQQMVRRLHGEVEQGRSLTEALSELKHFPPLLVRMAAAGERSGRLSEMLTEVGNIYDHEVERSMQMVANLIGPSLIVVLGGLVGFVVAAILLPVFEASSFVG